MAKKSDLTKEVVVLRSVYGKVGQVYYITPMRDPKTGRYPTYVDDQGITREIVKRVNSNHDMILTDAERNSGEYFVSEEDVFTVLDGTTFDLSDPIEKRKWEVIKNCPFIAPARNAKSASGELLIDGNKKRNGVAELYVEHPGEETQRRISKHEKRHMAEDLIMNDPKGADGRAMIAKLLGKHMDNLMDVDIKDYLYSIAEKDPDKIIQLYTGDDSSLRLLFIEAKDKKVIYIKNKLYFYADNILLGATDDAVITWMKDPKNKKTVDLIRKDTFAEFEKVTE